MDYRPNYYSNRNAIDKSNRYKKKRIFWLNSSFNSDFVLIDNKIYEISWDIPPFEIYKNNRLKLLTYIRDSNQSKPIQIKLKLPLTQSRDIINTDKEAFPIIYTNHSAVEAMTYGSNPIIRLIPQQISRFTFRLDDNYSQLDYNSYFNSITNGSVFQVVGGSPDDKYIVFNSSGSFVLDKNLNCDILIVGGGGGASAGGGGAGEVKYLTNQNLNSGSYTITIGAGGAGRRPSVARGDDGNDSFIQLSGSDIIRARKGGGGANNSQLATAPSGTYGSLGGAGHDSGATYSTFSAGTVLGNVGSRSTNGIDNAGNGYSSAGGGGGQGQVGQLGIDGNFFDQNNGALGGAGGNGILVPITGINNYYGGGGAGGTNINKSTNSKTIRPAGGLGGGGQGSLTDASGTIGEGLSATANTGGGGGGSDWETLTSGNGGSGVVIIRFKEIRNEGITAEENLIQATNNTITVNTDSKYVINYQNPVNIPKGTYETIFANGAITFKSKPDYNYPTTSKNPIVWYKFDGSQLLYDSSGNNNLINNNGVSIDTSIYTRGNGSALFNPSTSSYFTMPKLNYNTINTTNGISFSFWGRFKSTTGTYAAVFQFIGSGGHCLIYRDGGNNLTFFNEIVSPADVKYIATSGINNFDNTWRHYTWTISTTGIWNIYINGSATNNNFSGNVISSGLNANQSYVSSIGRRTDTNHNIDGNIDDFRIFDYVLSPVEVYDLYNGNTDRSYPILKYANNATINPLVWYQFDTTGLLLDSGTSINNLTNNASTLDITNFIKGNGSLSVGNGKYVSITNDIPFRTIQITNGITISLWFRGTSSSGTYGAIFHSGLSYVNDNTNVFKIIKDGSLTNLQFYYPRAGNNFTTSGTNYFTGAWHHIVWTISNTGVSTIYINGVNVNSSLSTANFNSGTNDYNSNKNLGRGSVSSEFLDGNIDDFRMYDITLTATQVSELYNGRISIYNPPAFLTGFELEDEDLFKENTISSYK